MVKLHSRATRLGVLDIGSNTVHMLIVDAAPGARPEPEASVKSTVRLMQYLKNDGKPASKPCSKRCARRWR